MNKLTWLEVVVEKQIPRLTASRTQGQNCVKTKKVSGGERKMLSAVIIIKYCYVRIKNLFVQVCIGIYL